MNRQLNKILKGIAVLTACFILTVCKAQTGPSFIKSLSGTGQLHKDSVVETYDKFFYDTAMNSRVFKPYYVKNFVTLRINEDTSFLFPSKFTVTLRVDITYTKYITIYDSVATTVRKDLTINYDSSGQYNGRYSFVFDSAQKVEVKIDSVYITQTSRDVLPAVILENEIQPYADYKFSCDGKSMQTLTTDISGVGTDGEVTMKWSNRIGIDEYELEWTFIDMKAYLNGLYGDVGNPDINKLFKNNATRISTTENAYSIPLVFPDEGILFARVRPIQIKSDGTRLTTYWSSNFAGGLAQYAFMGHQKNLNWQSSVTFAEDGKRKVVVQYYDGSLRGRQTVTKDNTSNTTIVAETYYDYQGRPSVQVLPAPTLSSIIQYTKNFNQGINGGEYDKGLYDTLINPDDCCRDTVPRMGTGSGAARYYSPQNIQPGQTIVSGLNRFLPDANGYAFTQTVYTQDNTGRIAKQSGVGATFKLGSGHETKYYYATPDQNELDALFGTEVGDKNHYFKNAVKDANGQFSVSYVDMHGRTIATALAGLPQSKLDTLSSYQPTQITETISDPESNTIKDNVVMESKKSLLVTSNDSTNYLFHYRLDPQTLMMSDCDSKNICYDCLYDLQITITDDCNNQKLPDAKPYVITVPHLSLNTPDTICNGQVYDTAFTLRLTAGNYEITKRLSVSQYGKDYYRDSIFIKHNTCKTLDDFIQQNREFFINTSCTPDCDSCRIKVGTIDNFRNSYVAMAGLDVADSALYRAEIVQSYHDALTACDALCGTTGITYTEDKRQALMDDKTAPFGQYANPDSTADVYSIYHVLPGGSIPRYKLGSITYYDETGKEDMVYDDTRQIFVNPNELDPVQFALKFKPSWAQSLLSYHPEYCKLLKYESYKASFEWDKGFEGCEGYALAKSATRKYLNPLDPGSAFDDTRDKLYNIDAPMATELKQKSDVYATVVIDGVNYDISMETFAAMGVGCEPDDATCRTAFISDHKTIADLSCSADQDKAWLMFRNLYEAAKKALIDQKVSTVSAGCISGVTDVPTAKQIFEAHRAPHFFVLDDIDAQTGFDGLTSITDVNTLTDSAKIRMRNQYESNCLAYSALWLQQLKNCTNYTESEINDVIIPRLVEVCIKGSDAEHPFGSSTISPDSTNRFNSFEEVIADYNRTHIPLITTNEFCNAELITKSDPFDKQTIYVNSAIDTKPDDKTCARISALHTEYLSYATATYPSFSDFMLKHYQTTISDNDLNKLMASCNTTGTCKYFDTAIILPPVLQPNSGAGCAGCNEVYGWYQSFKTTYGFEPTLLQEDTVAIKRNALFVSYMDKKLGFHKASYEYLSYINRCLAAANNNPKCVNCDSLQVFVKQYFDTLTLGAGNEAEMLQFIQSKLLVKGLNTTTTLIKQALTTCGNGWQQNIALKTSRASSYVFTSTTSIQNCSSFEIGKSSQKFTIELWSIHTNETDPFQDILNGVQPLVTSSNRNFSYGDDPTKFNEYHFKGYRLYWQHGQLYFHMGDQVKNVWVRTVQNVAYNVWHHVIVARDGNDSSGIKIYIDNIPYQTEVVLGYSKLINGDISLCGGLSIGNQSGSGGWGRPTPFIRNLRLYTRVLTETEIGTNYTNCNETLSKNTITNIIWIAIIYHN